MIVSILRKHISKRFLKYIGVGLGSLITEYFLFAIAIYIFGLGVIISQTVSYLVALSLNYIGTNYITFSARNHNSYSHKEQIKAFMLLAGINLLVSNMFMFFTIEYEVLSPYVAKIIIMGIMIIWNYFAYKRFIFSSR